MVRITITCGFFWGYFDKSFAQEKKFNLQQTANEKKNHQHDDKCKCE